MMNNKYKIIVKHPLVRHGIKIETSCSEKYLIPVINKIMELIRELNNKTNLKEE